MGIDGDLRRKANDLKFADRELYKFIVREGEQRVHDMVTKRAYEISSEQLPDLPTAPGGLQELMEDIRREHPLTASQIWDGPIHAADPPQGHTVTFPGNPKEVQIWQVDQPEMPVPEGTIDPDQTLLASTTRLQQREAIQWARAPAWATSYRAKYNHRTGETVAEWFNEFESQYAPTFFQLQAIDRGRVLEFKFAE